MFLRCHVVVIHPRAVEESPFGVAGRAERVLRKRRRIEVGMSVPRVGIQLERRADVVGLVDPVIVDAVRLGTEQ